MICRATRAVCTPSATIPRSLTTWSSVSPRASAAPTRWLRDMRLAQVTTRSPIPAIPLNVAGRAPSVAPTSEISANPRAISNALAFSPRSISVAMPAARATMFFSAPASSTPTTSSLS